MQVNSGSVFHHWSFFLGSLPTIVVALIWSLTGCGVSKPDLTWQRIQEQGVLRVGMDANWVPFEYVDGSGQLAGFDVALARELGKRLGLEVQFDANLSFDGLYDALWAERVDVVISAVVVDAGRSADFSYSTPYFDAGQVLVVGPDGTDIDGMEALSGRVLAVELGSEGDTLARHWARRRADVTLWHTDSAESALASVAADQADAALTDRASALMALKAGSRQSAPKGAEGQATSTGLYIGGEPVTGEQYAVVVRKESNELLRALNGSLADMQRDGTLQALEREWLGP
jgi:ABC-type amino acid transport substrate-binding protein